MELMVSGFYSSEVLVNVGRGVTNGEKVLNDGGLYHAGPGSFSIASLNWSQPTAPHGRGYVLEGPMPLLRGRFSGSKQGVQIRVRGEHVFRNR